MATTIHTYFIQCITNLHVGSGYANNDVVENLVQRDPITGFPTIPASCMKGALHGHFEKIWKDFPERIKSIFGTVDRVKSASGDYRFFGADLIAMPVRCSYQEYSQTLCAQLAEMINAKSKDLAEMEIFNIDILLDNSIYINQNPLPTQDIFIEDDLLTKRNFVKPIKCIGIDCFQQKFTFVENEKFAAYAKKLPLIVRTHIENGTSLNLRHEEIVPPQSVFVTYIAANEKYFIDFEKELTEGIIQIGANARIGYGLCKFSKIKWL